MAPPVATGQDARNPAGIPASFSGILNCSEIADLMRVRLQKSGKSRNIFSAGWSSLVARRAHNPEVVGSNPTPATIPSLENTNKTGPISIGPVNLPKIVLELYRQFAALDPASVAYLGIPAYFIT